MTRSTAKSDAPEPELDPPTEAITCVLFSFLRLQQSRTAHRIVICYENESPQTVAQSTQRRQLPFFSHAPRRRESDKGLSHALQLDSAPITSSFLSYSAMLDNCAL